MLLRGRSRAARPSPRVDRTRLAATPALDGWPSPRPPRGARATESGVQPDSSAATCGFALKGPLTCVGGPFWPFRGLPRQAAKGPSGVPRAAPKVAAPAGRHRLAAGGLRRRCERRPAPTVPCPPAHPCSVPLLPCSMGSSRTVPRVRPSPIPSSVQRGLEVVESRGPVEPCEGAATWPFQGQCRVRRRMPCVR